MHVRVSQYINVKYTTKQKYLRFDEKSLKHMKEISVP